MSAPLPAPQADLIRRIENATVTRSVIARKDRYHLGAVYDADGALVLESLRFPDKHRARDPKSLAMVRIDLGGLDRALDDLGCPRPGLVGRVLDMLDR